MLTSDELLQFGEEGMALTPAFCERLFEVVHTYDGRLDYKGDAAPLAWLRAERLLSHELWSTTLIATAAGTSIL